MIYYIYELIDQRDELVYYGMTINPQRRLKEHQKGLTTLHKQLYKRMIKRGVKSLKMNIIGEERKMNRAKQRETLFIVQAKLENKNILNNKIY